MLKKRSQRQENLWTEQYPSGQPIPRLVWCPRSKWSPISVWRKRPQLLVRTETVRRRVFWSVACAFWRLLRASDFWRRYRFFRGKAWRLRPICCRGSDAPPLISLLLLHWTAFGLFLDLVDWTISICNSSLQIKTRNTKRNR